jgi:hypothetical protein
LAQLEAEAGFPSAPTVRKWAQLDPAFADGLRRARDWRRDLRAERRVAARTFSAAWGEDFLRRIRRGEEVRALVGGPGRPTRRDLSAWRRAEPMFDAAVAAAVRASRGGARRRRRAYDEAVADAIVLRLVRGATMAQIYADPDLPGRHIVNRWRRIEPAFDAAVRIAHRVGWTAKLRPRSRCNDEALTEAICLHVLEGGSLLSAAHVVPRAPCQTTLYAWVRRFPEFARDVAIASQMRDELFMERGREALEDALAVGVAHGEAELAAQRRRFGQLHGGRKRRP